MRICAKCDKQFVTKYAMNRHYETCTMLYEDFRNKIKQLQHENILLIDENYDSKENIKMLTEYIKHLENKNVKLEDKIHNLNESNKKFNESIKSLQIYNKHFIDNISELQDKISKLQDTISELTIDYHKYKDLCLKYEGKLETTDKYHNQLVNIVGDVAKLPSNTVNANKTQYNYTNLVNLTSERILNEIPNLTEDVINQGYKGYCDWSLPFLKDSVICSDKSRLVLNYKSDDKIIKDIGGTQLCSYVFTNIDGPNNELLSKYLCKVSEEMCGSSMDVFEELTKKADSIVTLKNECKDAAKGIKNDFTTKFIKQLTTKL